MSSYRTDFARHIEDLVTNAYHGAETRASREQVFRLAFALLGVVALSVLDEFNRDLLHGTGTATVREPAEVSSGDIFGGWFLSWPTLLAHRSREGERLPDVEITAFFPSWFTHGHFGLRSSSGHREVVASWPMQVRSKDDAERQKPLLEAIVAAEIHDRIFRIGREGIGRQPLVLWDTHEGA